MVKGRSRISRAGLAWRVMGVAIVAYEVTAPPGQLLSEEADRWMVSHPWLTRSLIFSLAAHLCNLLPERMDPLHIVFTLYRDRMRAS